MKFQTVRKGYDPSAVDEYIKKLADDDNNVITEQKAAIEQLKKQNRDLEERLAGYNGRKEEIFSAFVEAQESSASLKRKAERLFEEEINRVKTFRDKWTAYAAEVVKTMAPSEAEKFAALSEKFDAALYRYAEKAPKAPQKNRRRDEGEFSPLKNVADLLDKFEKEEILSAAADTQSAQTADADGDTEICADISQAEIINVSESLEDLCKELGILDD